LNLSSSGSIFFQRNILYLLLRRALTQYEKNVNQTRVLENCEDEKAKLDEYDDGENTNDPFLFGFSV